MNEQKRDALAHALWPMYVGSEDNRHDTDGCGCGGECYRAVSIQAGVDEWLDALLPLVDTWLAEAERQGARRELLRVAYGIESQSPEMSFTDAQLYFRFADHLRSRAKAIKEETR